MQGESRMGIPAGIVSSTEAHQLTTAPFVSACQEEQRAQATSYENNNSQQLIYSHSQQVVAPKHQQLEQQVGASCPLLTSAKQPQPQQQAQQTHRHRGHCARAASFASNHQTSSDYLHLHQQGTNHQNLVRKHQQHKHQSQQQLQQVANGARYAVQQHHEQQRREAAAEYAVTAAAAAAAATATAATPAASQQQQACSPMMLSSPETCPMDEVMVGVAPAPATQTTLANNNQHQHYQLRARVGSISAPRPEGTPHSFSPTPLPAGRSMSFSATSAADALLAARHQHASPMASASDICCLSDTSASYPEHMAPGDLYTALRDQTPSLLSSSACSSIGSPSRPASLYNGQQSPPPTPVGAPAGQQGATSLMLYQPQQQQQQQQQPRLAGQQHHQTGYPFQQAYYQQQAYGCGRSSAPSGGSSTISTSDSLNMSINLEQYISKRNERERSRVRNVNDAFEHLKNSLPLEVEKMSKRMSKVEILRTAIGYIRDLEHTLGCERQSQQRQPGERSRQRHLSADQRDQIMATAKALRRECASQMQPAGPRGYKSINSNSGGSNNSGQSYAAELNMYNNYTQEFRASGEPERQEQREHQHQHQLMRYEY